MAVRPPSKPRESKPTIDAVNDAISALSDLVRSLRSSAKAASANAKREGREAKAKKAPKGTGEKVRAVGQRIKKGLERAWDVISDAGTEAQAKAKIAGRKVKRAVSE